MRFEEKTDMGEDAFKECLNRISEATPATKRRQASMLEDDRTPKRPTRAQDRPEWMVTFHKEALGAFTCQKNACETFLRKSQELRLSLALRKDLATNVLAQAYAQELEKADKVLQQACTDAGIWKLKQGKQGEPSQESDAPAFAAAYKDKSKALQLHKENYDKAAKHKIAEVQLLLAEGQAKS